MKTLILDIETSPNLAHVWGLFNQNVALNQLQEATRVLCFAAKWADSRKVLFHSEYADGHMGMLESAWDLLNQADAVVGWNSQSFDAKHLNAEFFTEHMNEPSPYKHIDLMRTVKSKFRFPSNKLDYVGGVADVGHKVKHEGHGLWVSCLNGDPKAWKRMEKYNRGDVVLTDSLYWRLLPWISNHPNIGLYNPKDEDQCPNCGSGSLRKQGFYTAETGRYQRYQCTLCGRWSRSTTRETSVKIRGI
jgi:hypothetical protein